MAAASDGVVTGRKLGVAAMAAAEALAPGAADGPIAVVVDPGPPPATWDCPGVGLGASGSSKPPRCTTNPNDTRPLAIRMTMAMSVARGIDAGARDGPVIAPPARCGASPAPLPNPRPRARRSRAIRPSDAV